MKMNKTLLALLMALLLALPSVAAPPQEPFKKPATPSGVASIDNTTFIDANNILMFVTNHGNFCRDLSDYFGYDAGTFYPYNTVADIESGLMDNWCLYASGLWVGATVDGGVRVTIAEYSDEYVPGPMQDGSFLPDNPSFKVYKLYKDSLADNPNDDYTNWPDEHGAPVDDQGNPKMIGDQMLWAVYNDADPVQHDNASGDTDPLGIEVRQTTFAFDRVGPLGNIIFIKLQIFNKGSNLLEDCYFSLWSDPDLGGAGDDLVGCDTMLSVGFVYNATNTDQQYGSAPPSVGYDFFQGPLEFTDDEADTAKMWDTVWAGYRNMGMVSFDKYINGTDPDNAQESYNYMRGLNRDGSPYTYNGIPTKYFMSGDPVAGTGDLDDTPADRRFMLSTGPVDFAPGDSTEILAAIIVGDGADRLSSISVMKYYDRFAQSAYDIDFAIPEPPASPVVNLIELDDKLSMIWTDTSEVSPGDYAFEGYTVYQGESPSGPWTRIANFDVINGTANILDDVLDPLTGVLEARGVKFGSDNGIRHHFIVDQDYINGGPLYNVTGYYLKVEAYSFDDAATPKTLTSATIVSGTPQSPIAGTEYAFDFDDTLAISHTGPSDGSATAYVVDPTAFENDNYTVTFSEDATLGPVWHMLMGSDTILKNQTNQTGDTDYEIVKGFLLKVLGPDPGVKDWDIPAGTRRFTWAGGAGNYEFEGFYGTIGWASPNYFWGTGTMTVPANETKDVVLRLATVDTLGIFDTDDENVSYAYRYGRGFTSPPAHPEFAPFMINTTSGGYSFQEFAKSVPLSAWDVESDPPRRLAMGHLENNAIGGMVDGKWWPPNCDDADNTDGDGPREWLFIYDADYSETPNADYQNGIIVPEIPVMYWITVARRGNVAFSPGATGEDEFEIIDNEVNAAGDTFSFTATASTIEVTGESNLDRINVVPNPFYLYGPYDPAPGNYQLKFQHLPENCTITIYNLGGDLIRTIEKDDPSTSIATWDTRTENGLPAASGIYIYVVEAPGYGTKIGKMAIFTEVEVLKVY